MWAGLLAAALLAGCGAAGTTGAGGRLAAPPAASGGGGAAGAGGQGAGAGFGAARGGVPAPPDRAAPDHPAVGPAAAQVELPGGRLLVVADLVPEQAAGPMPLVRRRVYLLQRGQGGGRVLAQVEVPLPGQRVAVRQQDLPGHPGAYVLEARLGRGEPRYAAVAVAGDRLEALDYYALTAPKPEVDRGPFLYVDKHLNQLWFFRDGKLVKTYPVATGRQTEGPPPTWQDFKTNYFTPEGRFAIGVKRVNPRYFGSATHPPAEPGAPNNPLGTRWLGFSVLQGDGAEIWGIHGTDEPEKIGTWVSDGCIRLYTPHVEELFDLVPQGTVLRIVAGRQ